MHIQSVSIEWTRGVRPADYETSKATARLDAELEHGDNPGECLDQLISVVQDRVWKTLGAPEHGPKVVPELSGPAQDAVATREASPTPVTEETKSEPQVQAEAQEAAQSGGAAEPSGGQAEQPMSGPDVDAAEEKAAEITDDDLVQMATKAAGAVGPQAVKDLANAYNVTRLQEIAGAQRAEAYEQLRLLAEGQADG